MFMKLIDEVYQQGKGVIVMVPEISLTPQTIGRFHKRYGNRVAVFHSALSMGERLDEWKRVKNGQALIAVGTRSAVFAPFELLWMRNRNIPISRNLLRGIMHGKLQNIVVHTIMLYWCWLPPLLL